MVVWNHYCPGKIARHGTHGLVSTLSPGRRPFPLIFHILSIFHHYIVHYYLGSGLNGPLWVILIPYQSQQLKSECEGSLFSFEMRSLRATTACGTLMAHCNSTCTANYPFAPPRRCASPGGGYRQRHWEIGNGVCWPLSSLIPPVNNVSCLHPPEHSAEGEVTGH